MIVTVKPDEAATWIRESFNSGSRLAKAVSREVDSRWSAAVLGFEGAEPTHPVSLSSSAAVGYSRRTASVDLEKSGALTSVARSLLFVEDDLQRGGDPHRDAERTFCVDDRVVRWSPEVSAWELRRLVDVGSSGWPLMAWACDATNPALRLDVDSALADGAIKVIAGLTSVVWTLAFDGAAYVMCQRRA